MRYWLDTEFIEDGKTIDLISIGIVADDGRELYLGNMQCDFSKASQWGKDNVLIEMGFDYSNPNIPMRPIDHYFWVAKETIAKKVIEFLYEPDLPHSYLSYEDLKAFYVPKKPEIWAYCADYDWVALCQLFGTMMDLPKGFPMYARDLKQECDRLGNPELPSQESGEHNALADAKWNKKAWEFLKDYNCNSGCVVNSDLR